MGLLLRMSLRRVSVEALVNIAIRAPCSGVYQSRLVNLAIGASC